MITLTLSAKGGYVRVHHDGQKVEMVHNTRTGRLKALYFAKGYARAAGEEWRVMDTRLVQRLETDGLIEGEGV